MSETRDQRFVQQVIEHLWGLIDFGRRAKLIADGFSLDPAIQALHDQAQELTDARAALERQSAEIIERGKKAVVSVTGDDVDALDIVSVESAWQGIEAAMASGEHAALCANDLAVQLRTATAALERQRVELRFTFVREVRDKATSLQRQYKLSRTAAIHEAFETLASEVLREAVATEKRIGTAERTSASR